MLSNQQLFVQVSDAAGTEIHRDETPLVLRTDTPLRAAVTLPMRHVPTEVLSRAVPIFSTVGTPPTPPPTASTPLENVRGIGPVTARRLRDAGIPDVETLLRTPGARLVEVAGLDADILRQRAQDAIATPPTRRRRSTGESQSRRG